MFFKIPTALKTLSYLYFYASLVLICCTGCIRIAVPEYYPNLAILGSGLKNDSLSSLQHSFSQDGYVQRAQKKQVILIDKASLLSTPVVAADLNATLGHQYVFGLLPLSSLFLPNGIAQSLPEIIATIFINRGYTVYFASAANLPSLIERMPQAFVVETELLNPRLNAFDLLIVRKISITGDAILKVSSGLSPQNIFVKEIDFSQYRKFAHVPTLAAEFYGQIGEVFSELIGEWENGLRYVHLGKKQPSVQTEKGGKEERIFFVSLPKLLNYTEPFIVKLGMLTAQSFGYLNQPAYEFSAIQRMLQQGVVQGLRGLPVASVAAMTDRPQDLLGREVIAKEIEAIAVPSAVPTILPKEQLPKDELLKDKFWLIEPLITGMKLSDSSGNQAEFGESLKDSFLQSDLSITEDPNYIELIIDFNFWATGQKNQTFLIPTDLFLKKLITVSCKLQQSLVTYNNLDASLSSESPWIDTLKTAMQDSVKTAFLTGQRQEVFNPEINQKIVCYPQL